MTDPVILLGTQSNGETLPVQVDGFGRLVAEGLQGPEGPPGPGGTGELPPDPYEGALLGWLNGGLAWVGTPPVPIPQGVFGPITAWDPQSGLLTVEGEIPADVGNGVYVWQCNQDGTFFTDGWNTSANWSAGVIFPNGSYVGGPCSGSNDAAFDGSVSTGICAAQGSSGDRGAVECIFITPSLTGNLQWWSRDDSNLYNRQVVVTDAYGDRTIQVGSRNSQWIDLGAVNNLTKISATGSYPGSGTIDALMLSDQMLVDNTLSLNLRVNSVLGQSLLGVPSATVDFTIGKYLRVPEQRVAPWVLYGNDPTSLIDHLRSS